MIRKETFLNDNCLTELRRIITSSEIMMEDDNVRVSSAHVSTRFSLCACSFGPKRTKLVDRCCSCYTHLPTI